MFVPNESRDVTRIGAPSVPCTACVRCGPPSSFGQAVDVRDIFCDTEDMLLDSVQRHIRGMHSLWLEATASMGAEHVNHFERSGVLPAAFSLNHMTRIEDQVVS